MRSLTTNTLSIGKPLKSHLRDRDGKVMVQAGTVLDRATVAVLPHTVFIDNGEGEIQTPSGAEGQGFLRSDRNRQAPNERRYERQPWTATITVTIDRQTLRGATQHALRVVAQDISRGGFSFIYRQFISPGSKVSIKLDMLPGEPVINGTVKSCVLIGGMEHRVGVAFDPVSKAEKPETRLLP